MSHTNSITRITPKKWQRHVKPNQDNTSNQNIMSQQPIETKPHSKKQCKYSSNGKHNNWQRTSRYVTQNVTCQRLQSVARRKVPRFGYVYNTCQVVFVDNLVMPSQLSQIKFVTKNWQKWSQNAIEIQSAYQYWNPVGIHVSRINTGFNAVPLTTYQMTSRTKSDVGLLPKVLFYYREKRSKKLFRTFSDSTSSNR